MEGRSEERWKGETEKLCWKEEGTEGMRDDAKEGECD